MRGEDVMVVRRVEEPTLEERLGPRVLDPALQLDELRLDLNDLHVNALDQLVEVAAPCRELLLSRLDELGESGLGLLRLFLEDLEGGMRVRGETLHLRLEGVLEDFRHGAAILRDQGYAVVVLHILVLERLYALSVLVEDRRELLPDRGVLASSRIRR